MSKQYAILTKNPKAGKTEWFCEYGIAFNSLSAASNSMQGAIDALLRANADISDREWCVVAVDFSDIIGPRPLWQRVKWAINFIIHGTLCHKVNIK